MGRTAMRVGVLAAWVGGLVLLAGWSETTPASVCAVVATIAAGALVGRWWAPIVPTVPAAVVIAGVLVSGRDPGEYWDSEPEAYAYAYFIAWAIVTGLLAVGIAARKLVERGRGRGARVTMGR